MRRTAPVAIAAAWILPVILLAMLWAACNRSRSKMLTKSIGIMYFNRRPSDDPRSVLFSNVLGLEELDAMGEDF